MKTTISQRTSKMQMLLNIQDYMTKVIRGETTLSPDNVDLFVEDCKKAVIGQLGGRERKYRIRMSGLGKPLCQQVCDKHGIEETMQYNSIMRFLYGDITEALMMLVMREAGIDIVDYQREVELNLDGHHITGTLDVIIRDGAGVEKVWDIKSASDWAFKNKFTGFGGYEAMKTDDPFGYIMQGFLYSEAVGMPFGGWIVVNKSSGEVAVVETYDWTGEDKDKYLADAKKRVKFLSDPDVAMFRPYTDEFETYKRKGEVIRTGNKVLPKECGLCGYKTHCWPNAVVHPRVTSQAKSPPMVWYSRLKTREI